MNNKTWAVFGLLAGLLSATAGKAQTDPKLHPGESVKVTKVVMVKKAAGKAPGDSVADVKVNYIKPGGSPGVLQVNNVGYSKGDSTKRKGHL
ncbi:hypothetical protein [Puia dinghuensis]|uniref:DUF1573 domain-containing protein n=1 Tax=Puia dinghuensis TaxID=1792502 RepID=A0A8J2XTE0_9BACT|nr:hypothetical protein [Puia dinghuensis]GGB02709.1 hypothetical protein GCM10011511_27510 [Puia dinghuensis]